jgi:hypothetical protein
MNDAVRFKQFCENPALGLDDAMQGVQGPSQAIPWRDYLQNLLNVLNQVPAVDLESANEADEALLNQVAELCNRHIRFLKSSRI